MCEAIYNPKPPEVATEADNLAGNAAWMAMHMIENYEYFQDPHASTHTKFEAYFVLSDPVHQLAHKLLCEELVITADGDQPDCLITGDGLHTKLFASVVSWSSEAARTQTVPEIVRYTTDF